MSIDEVHYYGNDIILRAGNIRVTRLHVFRIRSFIIELLNALGEESNAWGSIINEAVHYAIKLIYLREKVNSTLNELALVAFWFTTKIRGINKFNIIKLIRISRERLKRRILYSRILKLMSLVRLLNQEIDPRIEIRKLAINAIPKILKNPAISNKLLRGYSDRSYPTLLQRKIVNLTKMLKESWLSGNSRIVFAAILIYLADRWIAKENERKPILSAKILERIFGISQFTILRKYKKLAKDFGINV
ncbi:MAG: hypothetical protein ACP6IQ_04645 [Candidatus Njordarchaeia archaeon]|nr:hypothetical protein [Candidatus Korarchaeota archaeon]